MPGSTPIRAATVVAALLGMFIAYQWWNSPQRHIQRILDDVASAVSHDASDSSLSTLGAVAALQSHLAPEVSIDAGPAAEPVRGRQEVTAMAARLRASTPMMRVQFFDVEVDVMDAQANARATVQVTTRDRAGEDVASAHQVSIALAELDGRWLVTSASMRPQGESLP